MTSRWTDLQKEMNGYKRRLANKKSEVSLKTAPWENDDEDSDVGFRDVLRQGLQPIKDDD